MISSIHFYSNNQIEEKLTPYSRNVIILSIYVIQRQTYKVYSLYNIREV